MSRCNITKTFLCYNQCLLLLCFASDSPSNGGGDAVCIQGFLPLTLYFAVYNFDRLQNGFLVLSFYCSHLR